MLKTGNVDADRVLSLILAKAQSFPDVMREEIRTGDQSIFIPYPYLSFETGLDRAAILAALDYLAAHDYLRIDHGSLSNSHGAMIWLRVREAA